LSKSQISDELDTLITHDQSEVNVYLIGSMGYFNSASFNPVLSDADLLYIPNCRSLDDYVEHLTQAMKIARNFDSNAEPVDVFFLNKTIADIHLSCLSMILSANSVYGEDIIFGRGEWKVVGRDMPTSEIRKCLYKSYTTTFLVNYLNLLPRSNTELARKTVKELLRAIKMLMCSEIDLSLFEKYEKKLFSVNTFAQLEVLYKGIDKGSIQLLDTVLKTGVVDDWSAWMVAQEKVAEQLLKTIPKEMEDLRFYTALCQVRELLMVRMKDIILESTTSKQSRMMEEYVDEAIGVVTRLGIIGLDELAAFSEDTPEIVRESFEHLVDYLEGSEAINTLHLAASVVILEYALEQGTSPRNKITPKVLLK